MGVEAISSATAVASALAPSSQCYAPYQQTEAKWNKKIDKDFRGAYAHWGVNMGEWVLVHNETRGAAALIHEANRRDSEGPFHGQN